MRWKWQGVAGVAALGAAVLLPAGPAAAAPVQADLDTVINALGVGPKPADYVILVDTSGSMANSGRYERVKSALANLSRVLRPADRVSIVTFDAVPQIRVNDAVGSAASSIATALPAATTGKGTDIGLALETGLDLLERPAAKPVAALVLITDGALAAAPDSPYATVESPAWQALHARAAALSAKHEIAPYAVALSGATGAALLHQLFDDVQEVPDDEIEQRMARLDADLIKVQAANLLVPDLTGLIRATWEGDLTDLPAAGGTRGVSLTLASELAHVPVVLTALGVRGGSGVTVTGLPEAVALAPGQRVTIPLQLSWKGPSAGDLALTASFASPWQDVIEQQLGLTFAPVTGGTTPLTTAVPIDWAPYLPGVSTAAALLVAGTLFLVAWRSSRPPLVGSISLRRDGVLVEEILLDGRSLQLRKATATTSAVLDGTVHGASRRDPATGRRLAGVRLSMRGHKSSVTLFDQQSTTVDGVEVTYTTARTRLLARINPTDA